MVYLKDLAPCQPLAIESAPAALDLDGGGPEVQAWWEAPQNL